MSSRCTCMHTHTHTACSLCLTTCLGLGCLSWPRPHPCHPCLDRNLEQRHSASVSGFHEACGSAEKERQVRKTRGEVHVQCVRAQSKEWLFRGKGALGLDGGGSSFMEWVSRSQSALCLSAARDRLGPWRFNAHAYWRGGISPHRLVEEAGARRVFR